MAHSTTVGELVEALQEAFGQALHDEELATIATAGSVDLILAGCAAAAAEVTFDERRADHCRARGAVGRGAATYASFGAS